VLYKVGMNLVDFEDQLMILPWVQYHQHIKLQKVSDIYQVGF
jgi:hypothetical protein